MSQLTANFLTKKWLIHCAFILPFVLAILAVLADLTGVADFQIVNSHAIAFVAVSIAGLALDKGKRILACGCAVVAIIIALLRLFIVIYSESQSLPLSHVLMLQAKVGVSPSLAPLADGGVLLVGVTLLWLAGRQTLTREITVIASFCSIILATGLVSLIGYLFSFIGSYSSHSLLYLSLPTTACFISLSLGVLFLIAKRIYANRLGFYYLPLIVGGLALMLTLLFSQILNIRYGAAQDPITRLKVDLVSEHMQLQWNNDLLVLYLHLNSVVSANDFSELDYTMPDAFVGVYLENEQGRLIDKYQGNKHFVPAESLSQLAFLPAKANNAEKELAITHTEFFTWQNRPQLLLKVPFKEQAFNDQKIKSVVIRVDWQTFVNNSVTPLLSPQDNVQLLVKNEINDNQSIEIALPFVSQERVMVSQFAPSSLHQSQHQIVNIVFCFGLLITLALMVTTFFAQRSAIQSRRLIDEAETRNKYEAEINASHLSLKLAAEVAELGIWRWKVATGELKWSDRMYCMYEISAEQTQPGLLFDNWSRSLHPEDRDIVVNTLQQAAKQGDNWEREFRLLFADGRVKFIKASAMCYTDAKTHEVYVYGSNLDVTQERELRQQLQEKTLQAERSSLAKSQFLANMSHELRTPMNGVLGIGDLLAATQLNSKQQQYLGVMQSSAEKLLALLNDILDLSKIEAGEMNLEMICVPLEEVVADALKAMSTDAHQKGLDYHYIREKNVPEWVYTDPIRLGQILTNIVSNAIKFTESGGVKIKIGVQNQRVSAHNATILHFEVSDTGIGLSAEELDSIFKPFSQADESITRRYGGTGLGLSIVQQLLDLFKGKIDVHSELDKGTKVCFTIPVKLGAREECKDHNSADLDYYLKHAEHGLQDKRCLVVDSNSVNRQWLNDMLHSWHCNTSLCQDTVEALSAWQESIESQYYFDILIIDRHVHGMDAFDFVRGLKQQCREQDIPYPASIFILTSNNLEHDLNQCEELDIKQQLLKPVKQSEVFNAIMTALGEKKGFVQENQSITPVAQDKSLRILMAEDHPVNQLLVKEVLEARGHYLHIVENGRLAVEALEDQDFDIILMDVQMPVMDGLTATKMIRERPEYDKIYIVGLTAKALKEDKLICLDAGMDHYLSKPIKPQELITALENKSRLKVSQDTAQPITQPKVNDTDVPLEYKVFSLKRSMLTTGDDIDLLIRMLKLTNENIQPNLAQITQLQANKNWSQLAKLIHKCKGMLANFCEPNSIKLMEELIEAAENSDVDAIGRLIPDITNNINRFHQEMHDFVTNNNTKAD